MTARSATFLLLSAIPMLCRGESELCVTVRDPAGLAVPEAQVVVEPQVAAAILRGVTDLDGRFCRPVPAGQHIVRISHGMLMGAAAPVRVPVAGGVIERAFVLQVAAVASNLHVTASRLPDSLLEIPTPVRLDHFHLYHSPCP